MKEIETVRDQEDKVLEQVEVREVVNSTFFFIIKMTSPIAQKKIKVLNLYAGIGGNRKLWQNVEVTAVEMNKSIAKIYQEFFPDDKVIVNDAHKYLLAHYKEFDFIWSSPPCVKHSRYNIPRISQGKGEYIDMRLWQEIIFLQWNCKNIKWVVENVISYYKPLIQPKLLGRHYYWSNFFIRYIKQNINEDIARFGIEKMSKYHNIQLPRCNLDTYNKRKILRNCVNPKHGLHIFNCALKEKQVTLK